MTPEEKQVLEQVEKKLDSIIDFFNIDGKRRTTVKEAEDLARVEVAKFHERKKLKSSPEMGKVLTIKRKGERKDERERTQA